METIRESMEMAQCIILRTLPLLGSPGIEQKPLISPVILFQQSLSCSLCVCISVNVCPKFSDVNWKFDLSFIFSPYFIFFFPPCPKKRSEFVCVCARVCMRASVNPFCQVLAQPFLSKLPA